MQGPACLPAIAPRARAGCVVQTPGPVTTTTVQRDIVTTTPVTTREVVVTRTPPPVRVETQTVSPGPGYIWARGHWRWTGTDYAWVPGTYVVRPRPAANYTEGHWVRRPGGWVWGE